MKKTKLKKFKNIKHAGDRGHKMKYYSEWDKRYILLPAIFFVVLWVFLTAVIGEIPAANLSSGHGKKTDVRDRYEPQDNQEDIDEFSVPPGWDKGKKTGWDGADVPPGWEKDKASDGNENGFDNKGEQGKKRKTQERLEQLKKEEPGKYEQIMQGRHQVQERFKKLKDLRETNPEKYKELMKERMQYLKENNPERYESIMKKRQAGKERYEELQKLRREDPEKFRQIMKERLEQLKENNPEQYERIMKKRREAREQKRQEIKERLERLKKEDPQRYEQIKQKLQERRQQGSEQEEGKDSGFTPPGWDKGKKTGWDGADTPPGWEKRKN